MSAFVGNPDQIRRFHERCERVNARTAEAQKDSRRLRARARAAQPAGLVSNLFALASGAGAVVLSRLIRVSVIESGGPATSLQNAMIQDALIALGAVLLVKTMFRLKTRQFVVLQAPAMLVMLIGMHNAVHAAPGMFRELFPDQWVEGVLATTPPHSIILTGDAIVF